jgi:hypothetical protein
VLSITDRDLWTTRSSSLRFVLRRNNQRYLVSLISGNDRHSRIDPAALCVSNPA